MLPRCIVCGRFVWPGKVKCRLCRYDIFMQQLFEFGTDHRASSVKSVAPDNIKQLRNDLAIVLGYLEHKNWLDEGRSEALVKWINDGYPGTLLTPRVPGKKSDIISSSLEMIARIKHLAR